MRNALQVEGRMVDRPKLLNVRMTEAEIEMVKELAESAGLSQSDIIRQLVRQAHAELDTKTKRKPKR
jgi:predicted DNA binding CopG/RHH family protein